jgi:hypothetical protein
MNDNKLIAEFMGLSHCSEGWITIPYHGREEVAEGEIVDELRYDTSWDWLMPVLSKILDLSFQDDGDAEDFYSIRDCVPDINHTHKAVVYFIQEYRLTPKEVV